MRQLAFYSLVLLITLIGFQNCSEVNFEELQGKLVAQDLETNSNDPLGDNECNLLGTNCDPLPPGCEEGDPECDNQVPPPVNCEADASCDDPPPPPVVDEPNSGRVYVCILEGPGKSQKLSFDNALMSDKSTPQTVCLSQHACLNIVSAAFVVKAAVVRGYCPAKNKHVIEITDEQMALKIEELL